MRALTRALLPSAFLALGILSCGRAAAQPDSAAAGAGDNRLEAAAAEALIADDPTAEEDEITVQGRRNQLGKFRLEMTKAKHQIVEVFNSINSSPATDIKCRTEKPTGTRMGHSVCRSRAEDAADAAVARGMLDALLLSSGGHYTGPAAAAGGSAQVNALAGMSRARAEGANGEEEARAKLEAELKKLMAENRDLFRAAVKYVEARDNYNRARGQGQIIYKDGSPLQE